MRQWLHIGTNVVVIVVALVLLGTHVGPFPDWWAERKVNARASAVWGGVTALAHPPQKEAPFHAVIVSDYACVHCRAMYADLSQTLLRHPNINIGYLHYPLQGIDSTPGYAARVATCATALGKFDEVHSLLLLEDEWNPRQGVDIQWRDFASAAGVVDVNAFLRCLDSEETGRELERHMAAVAEIGIAGTPIVLFPNSLHVGRMTMADLLNRLPEDAAFESIK